MSKGEDSSSPRLLLFHQKWIWLMSRHDGPCDCNQALLVCFLSIFASSLGLVHSITSGDFLPLFACVPFILNYVPATWAVQLSSSTQKLFLIRESLQQGLLSAKRLPCCPHFNIKHSESFPSVFGGHHLIYICEYQPFFFWLNIAGFLPKQKKRVMLQV